MKDWIDIKEVRKEVKEKIGHSAIVNKSNSQVMQIAFDNNIVSANDMHIWDIQEQCRIGI
tara:strand:+ start:613 stop:792 length:180 start_codon:yes stop_codon:yes gene_type:complete